MRGQLKGVLKSKIGNKSFSAVPAPCLELLQKQQTDTQSIQLDNRKALLAHLFNSFDHLVLTSFEGETITAKTKLYVVANYGCIGL